MSVATFPQEALGWLGRLPAGWQVKPLKHVVRVNPGVLSDSTDPDWRMIYADISSVSLGQGIVDAEEFDFADAPSRARRLVKAGDTLVSTVRTYLRAITVVREPPENLVASTGFAVLRPSLELNANFLGYFATSDAFVNAVVAQSVGVSYPATNATDIVRLPIAFPDIEQQQKIAAFLDRKTAEIDTLIAKKRRLLDRLAEKRTALITRAVTKGLNPDAPMKDSGIEWLGEIPAHWEVMPVRRLAKSVKNAIKVGPFGNQLVLSEMLDGDQDVLVFNQRSVLDKDFSNKKYTISEEKFLELAAFEVFPRDLLISTRGTIGRCAVAPDSIQKGVLHPCLMRIRLDESYVLPEFLEFLVEDSPIAIEQLRLASNSTTIDVIYSNTLKAVKVPIPPTEEQEQVISAIKQYNTEIDQISEKVKLAITALEEYRSALITNAVTGQIKVA